MLMAMNVEQISACACSSVVHLHFRTPSADTSPDTCHCSAAVQSVRCGAYLKYRCCSAYCPNTSMRLSHLGSYLKVASLCKPGCCIRKHSRTSIDTCTTILVIWVTKVLSKCAQSIRCTFTVLQTFLFKTLTNAIRIISPHFI